jgi:hypothetical protein
MEPSRKDEKEKGFYTLGGFNDQVQKAQHGAA